MVAAGTGAITLGSITATGAGALEAIGAGAVTLAALEVSGIGSLGITGGGSITLGSVIVVGIGRGSAFVALFLPYTLSASLMASAAEDTNDPTGSGPDPFGIDPGQTTEL